MNYSSIPLDFMKLDSLKFPVKVEDGPFGWKKLTWKTILFGENFTVYGTLPPGFPAAHPDFCYFAKEDLDRVDHIGQGSILRNSLGMAYAHPHPAPHFPELYLCVFIHLQVWNPNRDSAATYVRVINNTLNRMEAPKVDDHE